MSNDSVVLSVDGMIGTILLNRPEKLNAFNLQMLSDLRSVMDKAQADPNIRVLIIKGAGRAFSVGMDIEGGSTPAELGVAADRERLQACVEVFLRVWDFPKPVIAQVHGFCCAAATMLALSCDITLVSEDCRIRFPSIPIGGGFVSSFWAFFVGPKKAKEMDFIAGSEVSGAEAQSWGWANHALPVADLEPRAKRMAELISKTPSDLLRMKKLAINRVSEWQGFRQAMLAGAEWDTLSHFTQGATEMRERIVTLGLKGAIRTMQVPPA